MAVDFAAVQWGNVAAWAGSLLTAGTLFMSLRIFARDRKDRRREQASKVNGWIEKIQSDPLVIATGVHNASHAPVYDVHFSIYVLFLQDRKATYYRWSGTHNPHAFPPTVAPETLTMRLRHQLPEIATNPPLSIPAAVIESRFTDSAGVSWSRSAGGILTEIKKPVFRISVRKILMNHYGAWPPLDKQDKWWVGVLSKIWFDHKTLRFDRSRQWKFIRTPENVRVVEEEDLERILREVADSRTTDKERK